MMKGCKKMAGYLHEMIGDCFELYIYVHSKAFFIFFQFKLNADIKIFYFDSFDLSKLKNLIILLWPQLKLYILACLSFSFIIYFISKWP